MADCYLCGAWIERGCGYRRKVETETSSRVYVTRSGGASFGQRNALRTLCKTCAAITDKVDGEATLRAILYTAGLGASVWFGWNLATEGRGLVALVGGAFLFGVPVLIVGCVLERMRYRQIVRGLRKNEAASNLPGMDGYSSLSAVLQSNADRSGAARPIAALAGIAGSSRSEPIFRADETLAGWCQRAASQSAQEGGNYQGIHRKLLNLTKLTRQKVGESLSQFDIRATSQLEYIKANRHDATFCRYTPGESGEDWLRRTGPMYFLPLIQDGESCEDTISVFLPFARVHPPLVAEDVEGWLERVMPHVDAML